MKFETFNFFIIHIFLIQNVEDNILVKKRNFRTVKNFTGLL